MAVAELRLWKDKIVSIGGTPYVYDGNEYRFGRSGPFTTYSYPDVSEPFPAAPGLEPIWGTGSYYSSSARWPDFFHIRHGEVSSQGLAYKFKNTVTISKVIFMIHNLGHHNYRFETGKSTFTASDDLQKNPFKDYGSSGIPRYAEI